MVRFFGGSVEELADETLVSAGWWPSSRFISAISSSSFARSASSPFKAISSSLLLSGIFGSPFFGAVKYYLIRRKNASLSQK
jgi:hypothetical protein